MEINSEGTQSIPYNCKLFCGESPIFVDYLHCRVKKTQLDAQIILSIFLQPLNVSGVSRPIHKVVPPDDGPRYARNMQRLKKYTKNKLRIKLVFFYTNISRCTVNKT
jgi:hypothetical protein